MKVPLVKNLLLITAFLLVPLSSAYGEWTYVTDNDDGAMFFLDLARIESVSKSSTRAWVKSVPPKPLPEKGRLISGLVAHMEFDCAAKRYRFLEMTSLYTDGARDTDLYTEREWRDILPQSSFEIVSLTVCIKQDGRVQ